MEVKWEDLLILKLVEYFNGMDGAGGREEFKKINAREPDTIFFNAILRQLTEEAMIHILADNDKRELHDMKDKTYGCYLCLTEFQGMNLHLTFIHKCNQHIC